MLKAPRSQINFAQENFERYKGLTDVRAWNTLRAHFVATPCGGRMDET